MLFDTYLQRKIKQNMDEWKQGRWYSQKQALAVSYAQTRKYCSRHKCGHRNKSRGKSGKKSRAKSGKNGRAKGKKSRGRK